MNADQAALSGAKSWSLVSTLSTQVGSGTFTSSEWDRNAYVGTSLSLEGAYIFSLPAAYRLRVFARAALDWEYTLPDAANGRRVNWSDLTLGVSTKLIHVPVIDIDIWGSTRVVLPMSLASLHARLVMGVVPAAGLSRTWHWDAWQTEMSFTARFDSSFRANLHTHTTPLQTVDATQSVITRSSDVILGNALARGFASQQFATTQQLTLSFAPHPNWSLTVMGAITNTWSYDTPLDSMSSPYAIGGAGRADIVRTNIDLTYAVLPQLYVSAGIFTAAPALTPDGTTLYNPLWNQQSAANNYSTVYMAVTAAL